MKKIAVILLIMSFVLALGGCMSEENNSSETSTQIVVLPNEATAENVNGYKAESAVSSSSQKETSTSVDSSSLVESSSSQPESTYYVGNKNSKKFHTQYCKYVSSISDKNLHSFKTVDEAVEQGYSPCGYCMKE